MFLTEMHVLVLMSWPVIEPRNELYGLNNLLSWVKDQAIFYLTLNIFLSSQGCGNQTWLGTKKIIYGNTNMWHLKPIKEVVFVIVK